MGHDLRLLQLLQLASPALPVGGYSYSQGLESAVEAKLVHDEESARVWIEDLLRSVVGEFEAVAWLRVYAAWCDQDHARLGDWNRRILAARDTKEFRAEALQMGYSLRRLIVDAGWMDAVSLRRLHAMDEVGFCTGFAGLCAHWGIAAKEGLSAFLWTWLENQVMGAVKLVPLGQVAGQRMLQGLSSVLYEVAEDAMHRTDDELNNFAPALAILSSQHESLHSRLFRS